MGRETVFIGFGSNVGDRLDFCDRAVTLLSLLPHPRLHQRRVVLMPLNELAPLFQHPVLERTVSQVLAHVGKQPELRLLFPQPATRYGSRPASSPPPGS